MAEDSKISIDSDWKKQAQEEKKRLAEQEAARKQQQQTVAAAPLGAIGTSKSPAKQALKENLQVGLESLIQTLVTQALVYLGDMPIQGRQNMVNLDMAKNFVDMLSLLDEKTKGNLTEQEKGSMDAALYEIRMRYIAVASRYAELV